MEALGVAAAGTLFGYNRKNFMFDGERRLKREYQGQNMHVARFGLFREDVRDLVELTVGKMENYLIINTITMGLNVVLFTEGRPRPGLSPPWLLWLWAVSGAGAFMYIILCIWLALQASISSHSFGVRILTQLVRLPIADSELIENARAKAVDYEGKSVIWDMLRVPVARQQLERVPAARQQLQQVKKLLHEWEFVSAEDEALAMADQASVASDDAASDSGNVENDGEGNMVPASMLKHVKLFRQLQENWQAYDAYARVSMAMGNNQLLQMLAYTCLMGFMAQNSSVVPGMACILVFTVCAFLLIRLDLDVSRAELVLIAALNISPPALASAALVLTLSEGERVRFFGDSLIPATFALHLVWLIYFLRLARAKTFNNIALPTSFRSVLYLDVYGWLNPPRPNAGGGARAAAEETVADERQLSDPGPSGFESLLSVVPENEPAAPPEYEPAARAENRPQADLPSGHRTSLARTCWEMELSLQTDLSLIEAPETASSYDAYFAEDVSELRKQLDSLHARLSEVARDDAVNVPRAGATAGPQVWLRLEWNSSGRAMEYFHPCGSDDIQVSWTRPSPPDRVLDLETLRQRLGELGEKVNLLSVSQRSPEADVLEPPSADTDVLARGSMPCRRASPASSCSANSDLREAVAPPQQQPGAARAAEPISQVTQYGGHEAIQMADAQTSAFAHGFHPHATSVGPGDHEGVAARARSRYRKPGHIPWSTLYWGSVVLIAAWGTGLFWSLARLANAAWDIMKEPEPEAPDLQLLHAGPWPHDFFTPMGLACRSDIGDGSGSNLTLLVAEKHAVHQLRANKGSEWALEPAQAEARCLEGAPEFQAAGLRSVALECTGKGCRSVLLGAAGQAALRCRPDGSPEHIRLYGGPWQDFSWGKSAAAGIWAQPAATKRAGATLLESRLTADGLQSSSEFVPGMQLPSSSATDAAAVLDALEGGGLLELSTEGELRAWLPSAKTGRLLSTGWSYRLPASLDMRWSGLCAAHGSAYLLGRPTGGRLGSARQPQVWRLKLPAAVAKLQYES
eukprot:TRINITY_DN26368_c0_g2_i1.p1 TRINITY_DN26368_c0_g2~~TRINITY_DN26368_c0_g2_i1.p1  ORF type:complete len:1032 (-),score=187.55 TRINITY_DN26368_c0_g2_i1:50-3145(-)